MIDARHYSVREPLGRGLEILIRSLRPDDVERMAEAFAKLDPESIASRFFGAKAGLTEEDRSLIRNLDFETRVILVATLVEAGREIVIASGSYSCAAPDTACRRSTRSSSKTSRPSYVRHRSSSWVTAPGMAADGHRRSASAWHPRPRSAR